MSALSQDFLVGLIALVVALLIARRIGRGLRDGRLPIYRTHVLRDEQPGRFQVMLFLHGLSLVLVAIVAADLLLGLGLRERM